MEAGVHVTLPLGHPLFHPERAHLRAVDHSCYNVSIAMSYCEVEPVNKYLFTVVIERQPEGEYLVSVPALPGCYTEGLTLEEARTNAADAIRAYCSSLLKHGEPIPTESGAEQYVGRLSVAVEPV